MKKILLPAVLAGLLSSGAWASNTGTATVNTQISAIHELAVSGGEATLNVNAAVAGAAPTSVSDSSTVSYAITLNEASHLTAKLNSAMPTGVTLNLTAASGLGTSAGAVALTGSDQTVVSAIAAGNESGQALTFELQATSAAGTLSSVAKTVTLTIVKDGA